MWYKSSMKRALLLQRFKSIWFDWKMRSYIGLASRTSWRLQGQQLRNLQIRCMATGNEFEWVHSDAGMLEVWAWGKGEAGQLGSGDDSTRRSPHLIISIEDSQNLQLAPMQGFPYVSCHMGQLGVAVTQGGNALHDCSRAKVQKGGALVEQGAEDGGNLDASTTGVACGLFHSALLVDGELWIWGKGDGGRLGLGSEQSKYSPTLNPYIGNVESIALGGLHSAAVTTQGELYTWGYGGFGALGHGVCTRELLPRKVNFSQNEKVVYVSAGGAHTAAITDSGELFTWGRDEGEGRLGLGDALVTDEGALPLPGKVKGIPGPVAAVSCGGFFTMALTSEGQVWNWGANSNFELGRGDIQSRSKPSPVPEIENLCIVQVASGGYHSAVLTEDGKVLTWGRGGDGQLGHDSFYNGKVPKVVEALADFKIVFVACGSSWTAAISDTGALHCWGKNRDFQLGFSGQMEAESLPVQLSFSMKGRQQQKLGSAVAVAAGCSHGICLMRS